MSIETELKEMLKDAVQKAFDEELELSSIVIETPKNKDHGDFSSNVAMQLTRLLHTNPREIANKIIENLDLEKANVSKVDIAGPGF